MTTAVVLEDEEYVPPDCVGDHDPCAHGLWISWEGGSVKMKFVLDESQRETLQHPHIHTPQLHNVQLRKGGGSGATVFSGDLGDDKLIWKHGDHKDMRDVFALAEIEKDLLGRAEFAPACAENLRSRIPRFAGVFISPAAFRVRSDELWDSLRQTILMWTAVDGDTSGVAVDGTSFRASLPRPVSRQRLSDVIYRRVTLLEGETHLDVLRREIRIYIKNLMKHPGDDEQFLAEFENLKELVYVLADLQQEHMWKFSVAQVAIGGAAPRTGASILTSGQLKGDILNDLLDQFIGVLHSLQAITLPEEKETVEQVKAELEALPEDVSPADLSPLLDSFVGSAIVKNWHPEKGRFKVAKDLGPGLRGEGGLILTPEEEVPANALGHLMRDIRSNMGGVFAQSCGWSPAVYFCEWHHVWKNLLREASSLKCNAATDYIWTCGLTDAGLHNMFFSGGRLWLFDLGKPNYQPLPAFLTKFLMSFFHALGMEDKVDGVGWVNRFEVLEIGGVLQVTDRTKELLALAHDAYTLTLDRLVDEVFDGEEAVRELMIQYTILQILSDASFCLRKWQIQGGGKQSYDNHHIGLEKWLWRALWDVYVASDVINTYLPSLVVENEKQS